MGHPLDRPASFWRQAWRGNPGDRVVLEVERAGTLLQVELTLQEPVRKQA
jgi:S1-C subfamily serine protease